MPRKAVKKKRNTRKASVKKKTPRKKTPSGTGLIVEETLSEYLDLVGSADYTKWEKYKQLYDTVPIIGSTIDMIAHLASRDYYFKGGEPEAREYCIKLAERLQIRDIFYNMIIDALIYGFSVAEIVWPNTTTPKYPFTSEVVSDLYGEIRKSLSDDPASYLLSQKDEERFKKYLERHDLPEGKPSWIKLLDPTHVRVIGSVRGIVYGYILTSGIQLWPWQVLHFVPFPQSNWFNRFYGTSILSRILKTQALINQLENDLAVIIHMHAKPTLIIMPQNEEMHLTPSERTDIEKTLKTHASHPGSSLFFPKRLDVKSVRDLLPQAMNLDYWLEYLTNSREAALGIPIFFTASRQANRAMSRATVTAFTSYLKHIQRRLAKTFEEQLFYPLLRRRFGEEKMRNPEKLPKMMLRHPFSLSIRDVAYVVRIMRETESWTQEEAREFLKKMIEEDVPQPQVEEGPEPEEGEVE